MAAPSYTEDLTDIDLAQSTTGYFAIGGGGAGLGTGADFAMQGTLCVDKQITNADKGQGFDNGSAITMGANDHIYVWAFLATPGLADTIQNRGLCVFIGSSSSAYVKFHVEGNDTFGAAGRVGKCYPIKYVNTSNTSPPYRTLTGSPTTSTQVFGVSANTTASVKGANLGLDAQRYGTGAFLTAGELISAGDASDNPCTFAGFNAQNDALSNRWGILTKVGTSYELQGIFAIGRNNAGTATLARFQDSDVNIIIPDTIHSATNFSRFEIDHASTVCNWTNINITPLGTNNKGQVIVTSADPTFNVTGGTWTDIDIVTLRSNSTVNGLTLRRTAAITLNQATLTDCVIDENTAASAVLTDDLGDITTCTFNSDGTGHAVELSSIGGGSMTWNNTLSGYAGTDGSTGNEAIYVNVGSGNLTINVSAGASTPSIRTAGANVTVVSGQVTTKVTVTTTTGTKIQNARVFLKASDGTGPFPYQESVSITRSGSTATVTHTGHGLATNDKVAIEGANQQEYNGVYQITVSDANTYTYTVSGTPTSPATGTIISTYTALEGLTDVNGEISASRAFSTDQPVTGWARKSSGSPYYKTAGISGTIDTATGFSTTAQMVSDE